jgi:uncharacterized protein YbjT (DUF2867 family)
MKVLVLGATGGSGRGAVAQLLADGHEVTAFVRRPGELPEHPRLRYHAGDAMSASDVDRAVQGHDAVVIALGIRENPFRVRLLGAARTPINIRSAGTRHAIAAMQKHGVRRLIVQSSYGVGATRERLRLIDALFFELLLKPQITDTELQERAVIESDLDWVIVQPVHLTDAADDAAPFDSVSGETRATSVSRRSVGRYIAHAVARPELVHASVALSGA